MSSISRGYWKYFFKWILPKNNSKEKMSGMRVFFEPMRTKAAAAIAVGYTAIGTPLVAPMRVMYIVNTTDAQLNFSIDGISDHFTLLESSYICLDFGANKNQDSTWNLPTGTTFYVKQVGAPSTGSVYVTSAYGSSISMMG